MTLEWIFEEVDSKSKINRYGAIKELCTVLYSGWDSKIVWRFEWMRSISKWVRDWGSQKERNSAIYRDAFQSLSKCTMLPMIAMGLGLFEQRHTKSK